MSSKCSRSGYDMLGPLAVAPRPPVLALLGLLGLLGCELDKSAQESVSASTTLPIGGAQLVLDDGSDLFVPSDAFPEDLRLLFEIADPAGRPPLPDGYEPVGSMYALLPHGTELDKSLQLSVPRLDYALEELSMFKLDDDEDQEWEQVDKPLVLSGRFVGISIDHFSYYQLVRPIDAAGGTRVPDLLGEPVTAALCGNGIVDADAGETCDGNCPTAESCQAPNACVQAVFVGDPASCDAICDMTTTVEVCASGDGCCPSGCTSAVDDDCTGVCGNGVIEGNETCEDGSDTPCPTTCDDGAACTMDTLVGDPATCSVACAYTTIVALVDGDGCCPDGANADNDSDCSASCGNDVVEASEGETCEPGVGAGCPDSCDDGAVCTDDRLSGSAAACSAICTSTDITMPRDGDGCCPPGANANTDDDCVPVCGNDVVEGNELCDGITCPRGCADSDPCTVDQAKGNRNQCNAYCERFPALPDPVSRDQCCPPGENATTDVDCAPSCGNGVVEAGEDCETGLPAGTPGTCSITCSNPDPCTVSRATGSGCNVTCVETTITSLIDGDSCCPSGANSNTDSDCSPTCGNGVVETGRGETCDGNCPTSCPASMGCTAFMLQGDATSCTAQCVPSAITIIRDGDGCCAQAFGANATNDNDCQPVCGNGIVESGEDCDGNCPTTCTSSNACAPETLVGTGCQRRCVPNPITAPADGDGCCPRSGGANAANDNDCVVTCNDGFLEGSETCDPLASCPTAAQCIAMNNGCSVYTLGGSQCTAACVGSTITTVQNGDGCCPAGANANNDNDCTPTCGNGVVETGEICDGNCPTTCTDMSSSCIDNQLSGTGCQRQCVATPITGRVNGDNCCPAGADATNDSDCNPTCGNNVVEMGELCDGNCPTSCPNPSACVDSQLTGSQCVAQCVNTPITIAADGDGCCPTGATEATDNDCMPMCGNGVVETGELCDGNCTACPAPTACTRVSQAGSANTCDLACTVTNLGPSGQVADQCCPSGGNANNDIDCAAVCGNGFIEGGEVCDDGTGNGTKTGGCNSYCTDTVLDYRTLAANFIVQTCAATASCHRQSLATGFPPAGNLDLSSPTSDVVLIGVPAVCNDIDPRVEPSKPSASVMLQKVDPGLPVATGCADQQVPHDGLLTPSQIRNLRDWIQALP